MEICNVQFNMPRPIDFIFNDIDDLLELSEYALMLISSNQAVNLAYVVFAKNPILLQDLWAWNRHSAEFCTWDAIKIHLHKAQRLWYKYESNSKRSTSALSPFTICPSSNISR